jgi:uncharacterized protein with NAD-binding domain and iron-sulfur cluster
MNTNKKIIIIGAGIAGMSAAMHLIQKGFVVEIYESSNSVGGRCHSVCEHSLCDEVSKKLNKNLDKKLFEIDNGQHLFSGAYKEFEKLLK